MVQWNHFFAGPVSLVDEGVYHGKLLGDLGSSASMMAFWGQNIDPTSGTPKIVDRPRLPTNGEATNGRSFRGGKAC